MLTALGPAITANRKVCKAFIAGEIGLSDGERARERLRLYVVMCDQTRSPHVQKGYLHLGRFYSILHTPKVIVKYLHGKHFHKQVFYAKLIMADLNAIFPKIGGCVFLALTLAFTFKHLSMLLYLFSFTSLSVSPRPPSRHLSPLFSLLEAYLRRYGRCGYSKYNTDTRNRKGKRERERKRRMRNSNASNKNDKKK